MRELVRNLLSSDIPQRYIHPGRPELVALHAIGEAVTALAYTSILCTLFYFVRRRHDVMFRWMFLAFGIFIIACGTTHALEIWTLWTPAYWLSGTVKAITALASAITAVSLIQLLPVALSIPTLPRFATTTDQLRHAHDVLERRVQERTRELTELNRQLANEIEERKLAERALARREQQYRRLVDSGIIGVIAMDKHGQVREANAAVLQMIGYTAEEVQAGHVRWSELTPPELHHLDQLAAERLRDTGAAPAWETECIRKDRTRMAILVGKVSVDEVSGERIAFLLDLTERKQAEEAIRLMSVQHHADMKMVALLEAAPDAMVIVNQEGRIVLVNAEAEALFGYARAELLDQPIERLVPSRLHATHRAHRTGYMQHPTQRRAMASERELVGLRRDGSEFPAEICLGPVYTDDGVLISAAIRDVTAHKQAEHELRRARDAAEAANAEIETFSYSVAHDLRAPLRSMNGFSTSLLEEYGDQLDSEVLRRLGRIVANARRMDEIIDALLSLARLTQKEARRFPVDLTQLGHAVIERLRASEPHREVKFVADEGLVVLGDPQLLRVMMENLLGNAWKFTSKQPAPRVELGREMMDVGVSYYVRDNGVGFDMALADKLFAPFRRLHSSSEFEGTGIGLATVQRIVQRHGGRLWAESAESHGATFRFTLPPGASTR